MLSIPRIVGVFSTGLMLAGGDVVSGQDFPNKVIRIIAGGVGGGSDFTARQIAQGISGPLGQPVIVENRGAGILSAEFLAKAPPDGYTLGVNGANLWISPLLEKTPYDTMKDFSPLSLISREVYILAVHPSMPAKSVKELIDLARAKPGQLNYGSGSVGSSNHLGMELLKSMTGVNIVPVPYKGTAAALKAVVAGEVPVAIADVGLVVPHAKSGRLRSLAVTSSDPTALAPGLPTMASAGLPGYELVGATGMWAPAKTPAAIISRVNQEVVRFLNRPEVKERFLSVQSEVVASSPEQFGATVKLEIAKWSKLFKEMGLKQAF